jgi:hypothetical protein
MTLHAIASERLDMDESNPEPERIPAPPESIPAPPLQIPAPPVAPPSSPAAPGQQQPGPVAQWTLPAAETKTSSTVAWVALVLAVFVLVTLLALIFLGGRVSQILSSIGTSV